MSPGAGTGNWLKRYWKLYRCLIIVFHVILRIITVFRWGSILLFKPFSQDDPTHNFYLFLSQPILHLSTVPVSVNGMISSFIIQTRLILRVKRHNINNLWWYNKCKPGLYQARMCFHSVYWYLNWPFSLSLITIKQFIVCVCVCMPIRGVYLFLLGIQEIGIFFLEFHFFFSGSIGVWTQVLPLVLTIYQGNRPLGAHP
jgi:hypothetical protein